jgi:hypothetical protein
MAVSLLLILAVGGAYAWGFHTNLDNHTHWCEAPCEVNFDRPMAEDNYGEDYHDGRLYVFKVAPDGEED